MKLRAILRDGICIENWTQVKEKLLFLTKHFRKRLIIPNPEYIQARRLGYAATTIDETLNLYYWDPKRDYLVLPIGIMNELIAWTYGAIELVDKRRRVPRVFDSLIELFDYQEEAVDELMDALKAYGFGLLDSPPGSGKTEMALEVISRLGQNTLWITDKLELADQTKLRAVTRLDMDPKEIGLFGGGRKRMGKRLTIGLVQTLASMDEEDFSELTSAFGTIVIDEAHHTPARTWVSTIGKFQARYRFGVTGTVEREDGLEYITHLYFGPTTHQVRLDPKSKNRVIPELKTLTTDVVSDALEKHEEAMKAYEKAMLEGRRVRRPVMPYQDIMDEVLNDESRNQLLLNLLLEEAPGRHNLLISGRIEHCELLRNMLIASDPSWEDRSAVISSKTPPGKRREILKAAGAGDIQFLFSVNIAKEGLDLPILDQLFLVAGGRNATFVKQSVGRIQRPHPKKTACTVWDVIDKNVGVLAAHFYRHRLKVYKEMGIRTRR